MRWAAFILVALVAVAVQVSLGFVLTVHVESLGATLRVDFLAATAAILALRVRRATDAMLSAWLLGLLVDLATFDSPIGLYALSFALAAGLLWRVRGAVFIDKAITQVLLGLLFVLTAHGGAAMFDALYVRPGEGVLGRAMLDVALVSLCTAAVVPLLFALLRRVEGLVIVQPARRR